MNPSSVRPLHSAINLTCISPQQLKLLILLKAGITKAVKSLAIYEKAVTLPSELFKELLSLIKIAL